MENLEVEKVDVTERNVVLVTLRNKGAQEVSDYYRTVLSGKEYFFEIYSASELGDDMKGELIVLKLLYPRLGHTKAKIINASRGFVSSSFSAITDPEKAEKASSCRGII